MITVNPIKLETGLRPNRAGIPYTLLLRMEAMGFLGPLGIGSPGRCSRFEYFCQVIALRP